MIKDVQTKHLITYFDERGYFRELIRSTDNIFSEGFGQWSESLMHTGTIKAWHIHQEQTDWWYISEGVVRAVLCDMREVFKGIYLTSGPDWYERAVRVREIGEYNYEFSEYLLGGLNDPCILKIPPGVAHGLKVLQGPAKLFYITSKVYNPDDEGRISFDTLGYDWDKRDIR